MSGLVDPVLAAMLGGVIVGVLLTRLFDAFDGDAE